jgi:hypothetical protein
MNLLVVQRVLLFWSAAEVVREVLLLLESHHNHTQDL